ncbi:MAG: hypothetical protein HKM04_00435 [Legionellales bacterium]|nr:hypothetical protein [Legionellales bacterium]
MKLSPDAQRIRDNGWKQGSLLKIDKPLAICDTQKVLEIGIYIVVSQDCDIQTPSLQIEPYVEIILCQQKDKIDGNYTKGKNPRRIHISLSKGKEKMPFECEAKNRFFLQRSHLTMTKPCEEVFVSKDVVTDFINWLVKRYQRDAFPDNFNSRLDFDALRKIFKCEDHENICFILIRLHTEEELPSHECYQTSLILIIDEDISEFEKQKAENILEKLVKGIEKAKSIQVIDSDVLTLNDISANEFLELKRLDFDDFSFAE